MYSNDGTSSTASVNRYMKYRKGGGGGSSASLGSGWNNRRWSRGSIGSNVFGRGDSRGDLPFHTMRSDHSEPGPEMPRHPDYSSEASGDQSSPTIQEQRLTQLTCCEPRVSRVDE